jgi:hypothetical protein
MRLQPQRLRRTSPVVSSCSGANAPRALSPPSTARARGASSPSAPLSAAHATSCRPWSLPPTISCRRGVNARLPAWRRRCRSAAACTRPCRPAPVGATATAAWAARCPRAAASPARAEQFIVCDLREARVRLAAWSPRGTTRTSVPRDLEFCKATKRLDFINDRTTPLRVAADSTAGWISNCCGRLQLISADLAGHPACPP